MLSADASPRVGPRGPAVHVLRLLAATALAAERRRPRDPRACAQRAHGAEGGAGRAAAGGDPRAAAPPPWRVLSQVGTLENTALHCEHIVSLRPMLQLERNYKQIWSWYDEGLYILNRYVQCISTKVETYTSSSLFCMEFLTETPKLIDPSTRESRSVLVCLCFVSANS